jgi:hypothetical protein
VEPCPHRHKAHPWTGPETVDLLVDAARHAAYQSDDRAHWGSEDAPRGDAGQGGSRSCRCAPGDRAERAGMGGKDNPGRSRASELAASNERLVAAVVVARGVRGPQLIGGQLNCARWRLHVAGAAGEGALRLVGGAGTQIRPGATSATVELVSRR